MTDSRNPHLTASRVSWQHRLLVGALRTIRWKARLSPARIDRTVAKWSAKPPKFDPPAWSVRGVTVDRGEHAGWPVITLRPSGKLSAIGRTVVALHGGAYVAQITPFHWLTYSDIVKRAGATIIVPDYPLAPKAHAAEVVPATADLIGDVVKRHGGVAVTVTGDSAGAGLALAALQELVSRGAEVPSAAVFFSPFLDATVSDTASATVDDPMLDAAGLRVAGRMWAGDLDSADPRVSPLFGSLAGLPPITVYSGFLDLLYPDALRLQERADAAGADMTFVLRDGMLHDWMLFSNLLPEAKAARPQVLQALVGAPSVGT
ncbi:MAG: alpha/beta hydrolase fold domain-containing protein [Candidatus Nanopelagicales bacterium]